jgi:hypothetical protein
LSTVFGRNSPTMEIGIEWDETKKNIDMPESWWKKAIKVCAFKMFIHFKFLIVSMNITLICCITGHKRLFQV